MLRAVPRVVCEDGIDHVHTCVCGIRRGRGLLVSWLRRGRRLRLYQRCAPGAQLRLPWGQSPPPLIMSFPPSYIILYLSSPLLGYDRGSGPGGYGSYMPVTSLTRRRPRTQSGLAFLASRMAADNTCHTKQVVTVTQHLHACMRSPCQVSPCRHPS